MSVDSTSGVVGRESGVGDKPASSLRPPTPDLRLPTSEDRLLIRRLLILAAAVFVGVVVYSRLDLLYSHKFLDNTGRAQWIWPVHRMADGDPVAFFATHDFDLPPNRNFTRIKMLGDPEYTLYFNGVAVGGRRVGDGNQALDTYDVSSLAHDHGNRMVVAVRSANGVGGLIAAVDLTREFANFIVTGKDWHIVQWWHDDLLVRDPPAGEIGRPQLLGRPPARRWNYLVQKDAPFFAPAKQVIGVQQRFDFETALPEIAVLGGTAVMISRKTAATAYDFGTVTSGRVRLTIKKVENGPRNVTVRFAYERAQLFTVDEPVEQFVFAAGERTLLDEEIRNFRYITVYGGAATVDVLR